jgi:transcription initiation factor TFIIIB Brf1 subunit/transcription initiation factor TFIIB
MICPYCKSDKIILNENGEYVCTDCGTVVGYELVLPRVKLEMPLRRESRLLVFLQRETKETVKRKYSELVRFYVAKTARELGRPDLEHVALSTFQGLDKRVYQGKNPRVLAAALVYMAAEKTGYHIHKQQIALLLNISKFSIRDTVTKLRRHVDQE